MIRVLRTAAMKVMKTRRRGVQMGMWKMEGRHWKRVARYRKEIMRRRMKMQVLDINFFEFCIFCKIRNYQIKGEIEFFKIL